MLVSHYFSCFLFFLWRIVCLVFSHDEPKYDVRISTFSETSAQNLIKLEVFSKYGQKFMCNLPPAGSEESNKTYVPLNNSYVLSLLSALKSGPCLSFNKGWWTYELCYKRHVSQYHGSKRLAETLLGVFDSETDWDKQPATDIHQDMYHIQTYGNGSICDLTLKPRKTKVLYSCPEDGPFRILSVEESETCVYSVHVAAPTMCAHPAFLKSSPPKVEQISCSPVTLRDHATGPSTKTATQKRQVQEFKAFQRRSDLKRVVTFQNVYNRTRVNRLRRERRLMVGSVRRFLQCIQSPRSETNLFRYKDAFASYARNATRAVLSGNRVVSFAQTLKAIHLRLLKEALMREELHLQRHIDRIMKSVAASDSLPVRSEFLSVVHKLGTTLLSLIEGTLNQESGRPRLVVYPTMTIQQAVALFADCCDTLLHNYDSVTTRRVMERIRGLYIHYGLVKIPVVPFTSPLLMAVEDSMRSVQPNTTSQISNLSSVTPIEVLHLRQVWDVVKQQMVVMEHLLANAEQVEKLHKIEAEVQSTMQNLLAEKKFTVLVFRDLNSVSNRGDSKKPPPKLSEFYSKKPIPEEPSGNSFAVKRMMSLIKKVLATSSQDESHDIEMYESGKSTDGATTFFILSGGEKAKEDKRIQDLEAGYSFVENSKNSNSGEN
ncbi:unnamed protein product [Calicophoron daubneyi]|uniref:Endoplasmic reticulum lectin 1 n=1 Tax=Calicophoron daubneyi TaxID=300641 RepID=A0AAV2TJW8_CALDB